MPLIAVNLSSYTYWRLLDSGENASALVQRALAEYWKTHKDVVSRSSS
jgi:hypothetical protein